MQIGVLPTGDISVRAAHSLSAHPGIDRVVVIGPARSHNFRVVDTAAGCDYLIGSGPAALDIAAKHGVPLIWDGDSAEPGVAVWGASARGLTLALARDLRDPQLVALADPDAEVGDRPIRFPDPIGTVAVTNGFIGKHQVAVGKCENGFAACYVRAVERSLTIIDDHRFLKGVALGAAVTLTQGEPVAVWERPFPYLQTATDMGLVLGEAH